MVNASRKDHAVWGSTACGYIPLSPSFLFQSSLQANQQTHCPLNTIVGCWAFCFELVLLLTFPPSWIALPNCSLPVLQDQLYPTTRLFTHKVLLLAFLASVDATIIQLVSPLLLFSA